MAWGRGRSNRSKKEPGLPTDVVDAVRRLMRNRHAVLCPFKVDPMMLYRAMWSDPQWMALETLKDTGVLRTNNELSVIDVEVGGSFRMVKVSLSQQVPMGIFSTNNEIEQQDLPTEVWAEITHWANNWARHWQETEAVAEKADAVRKSCKTYGQLLRIWPELRGFLPEGARRVAEASRSRSKYPDAVIEYTYALRDQPDVYGKVKKRFRPEAFEPFTTMLAEALMMPEASAFGPARVEGLSFNLSEVE